MKIFVFDLDFTIWDAGGTWCDATNPPYFFKNGKLIDQSGNWIRPYPDVLKILDLLKENNKLIVAASRTYEPTWANNLMQLLEIDNYFDLKEIYPASKIRHFERIHHHFGIPYSEMIFFDDEYRNIEEVGKLGVKADFVRSGISLPMVQKYLK